AAGQAPQMELSQAGLARGQVLEQGGRAANSQIGSVGMLVVVKLPAVLRERSPGSFHALDSRVVDGGHAGTQPLPGLDLPMLYDQGGEGGGSGRENRQGGQGRIAEGEPEQASQGDQEKREPGIAQGVEGFAGGRRFGRESGQTVPVNGQG